MTRWTGLLARSETRTAGSYDFLLGRRSRRLVLIMKQAITVHASGPPDSKEGLFVCVVYYHYCDYTNLSASSVFDSSVCVF